MSRRAVAIVDEFDDDTDLPLPSRPIPLPNTGSRGPILQAVDLGDNDDDGDDDDDDDNDEDGEESDNLPNLLPSRAGPAGLSSQQGRNHPIVTDVTPYKKWTCVYPIYIDAKRAYTKGERRISRAKSVWWPLSKDIAEATNRLGLGTLHESNKSHPRDWENPGRVRVQWRKEGKLVNPAIKSKKQLLEMVSFQIQLTKPDNVPKPPFSTSPAGVNNASTSGTSDPSTTPLALPAPTPSTPSKSSTKGKQPASKSSGNKPTSASQSSSPGVTKKRGRQLPVPPGPFPSLASRVSAYSPALASGVLVETVKAGMSATEGGGMGGGLGGLGGLGGGGKGKRKVVRVRA